VTCRLNEWNNEQWNATIKSLDPGDQSQCKLTKRLIRVRTPSPLLVITGGVALTDSEKAEALADNLNTPCQPVTDPSFTAVIETVNVGLRSYFMAPAGVPKLNNPEDVQEAIVVTRSERLRA
jgi:hypothetical protein